MRETGRIPTFVPGGPRHETARGLIEEWRGVGAAAVEVRKWAMARADPE
jgi:hypothetical protein